MNTKRRRGFTLIELLIVIAILLAIGGLVVVNLIPRGEQAKADIQRIQLDQIASAMSQFRLDLDRWPSEDCWCRTAASTGYRTVVTSRLRTTEPHFSFFSRSEKRLWSLVVLMTKNQTIELTNRLGD